MSMKLTFFIGAVVAALISLQVRGEIERWIGVRSYPPSLVVVFSNLPPAWVVETSIDLTNWFSVVQSGEIPPRELEFSITNAGHGQYYRVTALEP